MGVSEAIDAASASGRKRSAPKNDSVATSSIVERSSCMRGCRVRQKPRPTRCHARGVTAIIWPA